MRESAQAVVPKREKAAILGAALDEAPVCVFVADAEMRYVAVNEHACDVLGYSEDELLTMRVSDVAVYDEATAEYAAMVESAYRRGVSRLRCKDGEEVVLSYVAGEVSVDGQPLFVSVGTLEPDAPDLAS